MTYTQFTYTVPEITKTELLNRTGIYKIVNTENGKFYIGSASISFYKRWGEHLRLLQKNAHINKHLQSAWNKYGELAFNFEIVEIVPPNECIETEQLYLDYSDFNFIYNICKIAGSCLGVKRSEETKLKIRESKNGNNYRFSKIDDKYILRFSINNKLYHFGYYLAENECVKMRDFLLTLSDEQKLEYWNNHYNRKLNTKGYYFDNQSNKYIIRLIVNGKRKCFGRYESEKDAVKRINELKQSLLFVYNEQLQ